MRRHMTKHQMLLFVYVLRSWCILFPSMQIVILSFSKTFCSLKSAEKYVWQQLTSHEHKQNILRRHQFDDLQYMYVWSVHVQYIHVHEQCACTYMYAHVQWKRQALLCANVAFLFLLRLTWVLPHQQVLHVLWRNHGSQPEVGHGQSFYQQFHANLWRSNKNAIIHRPSNALFLQFYPYYCSNYNKLQCSRN